MSSPLARATASSDPILARCTGWTAVTTPMDGRPMAARSAISPPTYIPISRTAASCSGPRRSTVSGRPISLFWLPSLLSVRIVVARTAATASLVEVLAMLPVMPTTSGVNRLRQPAATDPRAAMASATRTIVTSPSDVESAGDLVTRRAVAPRRTASARCAWPSVRSPGRAANRLPGCTARESTAAPRMGRSERASSRPPVRLVTSSAVSGRAGPGHGPADVGSASVIGGGVARPPLTGPASPARPSMVGRSGGPAS